MELSQLTTRNDEVIARLQPYLVATRFNLPHLHRHPLGLEIPSENIIDPLRLESEQFLLLLQRLDALTFGPEGMPMPRWVFYDCSELPGAIFGFGLPASALSARARELFEVPDGYTGLVPYSMYIAIPMFQRGSWFGHNLCSVAPTLPEEGLRGLGSITKALAMVVFGVRDFYGATQWDSEALFIHCKFGPLDLHTAYTPAHSEVETLTYHYEVTELGVKSALGVPGATIERPEPTEWVTHADVERMLSLQDELEAGARYVIPHAPAVRNGVLHVPIARVRPELPTP